MPEDIKTDATLLRRLSEAARKQLTREELRLQRISFIYGSLPQDSTITRQQIERVLNRAEGEAA
jgi:pseudouridine-5'-phosphate glycosidase